MDKDFINSLYQEHQACPQCPSPEVVSKFFQELLGTMFPVYYRMSFASLREFELHLDRLRLKLSQILERNPTEGNGNSPTEIADKFFEKLQEIKNALRKDAAAIFMGDPAAKDENEVVRSYPGFYAVAAYRVAHCLRTLGVRVVPRIITEHAHNQTGIDINPAAVIGESFCIDHGTGVVIGETCHIGNHVKVYQGVTLGALSVDKEDAEKKRHPTIEDNVVLYAGATILGGETVIGHDSTIGGNVWLTRSVEPYSKIYYKARMHNQKTDETDLILYKTENEAN